MGGVHSTTLPSKPLTSQNSISGETSHTWHTGLPLTTNYLVTVTSHYHGSGSS